MRYVPIAIQSEYSFPEGMCRIETLIERVQALGFTGLGVADRASTYSWLPLYVAARRANLQPILGVRLHLVDDSPSQQRGDTKLPEVILHAKNTEGMRNIQRLVSKAHLERGQEEPSITWEDLQKYRPGILLLDGGIAGPVGCNLMQGRAQEAVRAATRLKQIFGLDDFFIQIQKHSVAREAETEPQLLHIARQLNVSLVATPNSRYIDREDVEAQEVLRALRTGEPLRTTEAADHHLKNEVEMLRIFRDLPEALHNTHVVAERCQLDAEELTTLAPVYETEHGDHPQQRLIEAAKLGACKRYHVGSYQDVPVKARDRIAHELKIIEEKKLASCYLLVQDVVSCAKEEGVPIGPGCGAGTGSLVAHVIGIHEIDPLRHGLFFERLLEQEGRANLTFEFSVGHRELRRFEHLMRRTLGTRLVSMSRVRRLRGRSLIRQVGRVLGIEAAAMDTVLSRYRPVRSETVRSIFERLTIPPEIGRDHRIQKLIEVSSRLEDLPHHATLQPGGFLVRPKNAPAWLATMRHESRAVFVQMPSEIAGALGWLQIHVSPSRVLSCIAEAEAEAEAQAHGAAKTKTPAGDDSIDAGSLSLATALEDRVTRAFLTKHGNKNFAAMVQTLAWAQRRRRVGKRHNSQWLPRNVRATADTHGSVLFEEQVIEIGREIAHYSNAEAVEWLMDMRKKNLQKLAWRRRHFVNAAVEAEQAEEAAESIFDLCCAEADQLANRVFHTQQAMLLWRAARLASHSPSVYLAAALNNSSGQKAWVVGLLEKAREMGVEVLNPDLNESDLGVRAEGQHIRKGLAWISGWSDETAAEVLAERRKNGRFDSIDSLLKRCPSLGSQHVHALVRAGALTSLGVEPLQPELFGVKENFEADASDAGKHSQPEKPGVEEEEDMPEERTRRLEWAQTEPQQLSLDLEPVDERASHGESHGSDTEPRLWLAGSLKGKPKNAERTERRA